jgi:hypothetical protein
LGKPEWLKYLKIDLPYHGNPLVYFLLFCLPDVLWYYALLLLQKQFYNDSIFSKVLLICTVLLPFVLEIMQYFRILSGTFDFADIVFYLFTLVIFIFLWNKKRLL